MARWLVTQGDRQFAAESLDELVRLAREGALGPGDLVQPPGASDWLYATELPELKAALRADAAPADIDDDDDLALRRGPSPRVVAAVLVALLGVGAAGTWYYVRGLTEADYELFGENGLELTEMLVTAPEVVVRSEPDASASAVARVHKDDRIQLLAKRGPWYEVETADGRKGWVAVDEVVPAYYFADDATRQDYDPIYNPDRYIFVQNSSWRLLPSEQAGADNVTVFEFLLQNKSKFAMTDLVLAATIKDDAGNVLEREEFRIEGSVPPYANAWVGTLNPPEDAGPDAKPRPMTDALFKELSKDDPDLALRWVEGIEVEMQSEGFAEANIDIVQVRAVPRKLAKR